MPQKTSKDKESWYTKGLKALKIETTTASGRVNLGGTLIIAIFCGIYTASDKFCYLISSVSDAVKTIFLDKDIYHPYESVSVLKAASPTVFAFVLCLGYLLFDKWKKDKISDSAEKSDDER